MPNDMPNIQDAYLDRPSIDRLQVTGPSTHKPRILLLYGSLRERSYSRLMAEEAARILEAFGAETRFFNPSGLPLPDDAPAGHPKVVELRKLSEWSEGQVRNWSSSRFSPATSATTWWTATANAWPTIARSRWPVRRRPVDGGPEGPPYGG